MSVTRKAGLYCVQLGPSTPTTNLIGRITRRNVQLGLDVVSEASSGDVYPLTNYVRAGKPGASFATESLKIALDLCGLTGLSIAGLTGGLTLFMQYHTDAGGRTGGAANRKFNLTKGIICPVGLTAQHQGNAELHYIVVPTWDGTNDPVIESDSITLPTGFTNNLMWTLGKATVGGILLPEIKSVEVDFGIRLAPEGADSDIFDTFVSIEQTQPSVMWRGIDPEWLKAANIPRAGKAATHANTSFYFRKRLDASTYVADGTAEHIKFTAAGMVYIDDAANAQGQGGDEISLRLVAKYDGSNAPFVINTAIAIS